MGAVKGKWQAELKAAQASGLSLVDYAARQGINVRRLYEARYAAARARSATPARLANAPAFVRIKLKSQVPVNAKADGSQQHTPVPLTIQARLTNGVTLHWVHDTSNGPALADLMHTLAGLPCSV